VHKDGGVRLRDFRLETVQCLVPKVQPAIADQHEVEVLAPSLVEMALEGCKDCREWINSAPRRSVRRPDHRTPEAGTLTEQELNPWQQLVRGCVEIGCAIQPKGANYMDGANLIKSGGNEEGGNFLGGQARDTPYELGDSRHEEDVCEQAGAELAPLAGLTGGSVGIICV
jgi:hypothetical protein